MNRKIVYAFVALLVLAAIAGAVLALQGAPAVYWVIITQGDGTGLIGYTTHYGLASGRADGAEAWTDVLPNTVMYAQGAYHVSVAPTDGDGPTGDPVEYGVIGRETRTDGSLRLWLKR